MAKKQTGNLVSEVYHTQQQVLLQQPGLIQNTCEQASIHGKDFSQLGRTDAEDTKRVA